MLAPYNEGLAQQAVTKSLDQQTDSDPEATTPDPTGEDSNDTRDGGPVRRFNDVFTDLGMVQLEALALDGYEIALAARKYRRELFRNQFPILEPRFVDKCEHCEAEYDEDVEACIECTRAHLVSEGIDPNPPRDLDEIDPGHYQGQLRAPDPRQKRDAEQLFESVNKEGQSLRDLYKNCEDDHARLGVGMHVVKWDYAIARGDSNVFDAGEILYQGVDELVRADPKRVVPVVDENGRIGNYWYACPIHRPPHEASVVTRSPGRCPRCHATLQEVFYVEKEDGGATTRTPEKYYFDDEVVDWAFWYPRLNGKDGLSPAHHVWLKQSILHWMDVYGAAFYDPSSDRYPNKFMVVHTTNPDTWERNFKQAEEDAKENPYSQQIMMNEYSGESQSTPEVQVIDLMNDELLGQDEQLKKQFKSDIRQAWDVTDVFDSELEDAGGLNNEGLQLEVTDRGIATRQHDLTTGPLDRLAKLIGLTDYRVTFIPPQDTDVEQRQAKVDLGQSAADAGLDARWEDDEVEIADGEFEEAADDGGGGGFFSEDGDETVDGDGGGLEDTFGGFSDGELDQLASKLADAHEHIVWANGPEQKAEPFWDAEDVVPEFVQDALDTVLEKYDVISERIQDLTSSQIKELEDVFREQLTQPQGWSLESMTDAIEEQFDVAREKAETWARTESSRVLNKTREETYKQQAGDEEASGKKFKWTGPGTPDDGRTTDACVWLKEQTDPAFGGETRPLPELKELVEEAADRFFPELTYEGDFVVHPHERHTFVESFKADDGAGPVAGFGTFVEADA